LGESPLVLSVRGDARICVPPILEQTTCYVLLEQEDWFEDEIHFVRRWLRPGMRAVDIGAAFGLYTVAMARAVGAQGRVWAYEPTPATGDYLARTLELNRLGNASLIRSAIAGRSGQVRIVLSERPEENEIVAAGADPGGSVAVAAVTLDQAARDQGWGEVDFIKLDVEGHELEAIQGGSGYLGAHSPLLMFEIKARGEFDLRALDPLAALGYEFFRLLPGPLALTRFDRSARIDGFQLNLFACKPERGARLAADGFLAAAGVGERDAPWEAWTEYARTMPYAKELSARWRAKPGFFSSSADRSYLAGLAAFARSREGALSPAERSAWLARALALVENAVDPGDSLARRLTYARLAWETGQRERACETLADAVLRLDYADADALADPFLAPGPRYDKVAVEGRPLDWLRCAVVEQYEKVHAHSSRFTGEGSLQVLERIHGLPFQSAEMERRRQLVRMSLGRQARPEPAPILCQQNEENLNPDIWCPLVASSARAVAEKPAEFPLASVIPDLPRLKIVDIGAMSLGEGEDPYSELMKTLPCEVIGFEPLPEECEKLNRSAGAHRRYLPHFIGDGSEQTFHRCAAPMTSSLLEPDAALMSMFQTLGELTRVVATQRVQTTRLDDIAQARGTDFLKIDVQGGELMVLQGARETLRDVLLIHTEAEFLPLYKDQPLFGDLDAFLRREGFVLHKIATVDGRAFKPMVREGDPSRLISQLLWCDVVYVRDFTAFDRLSPVQLRKLAAILHANYGSFDLASVALAAHDRQTGSGLQQRYLDCFAQATP
jgi:FkbM family methyltransferase